MVGELVEEHKPLAYIIGTQPFYPLPRELLVRPPTLIPRPETEHWLQQLSNILSAFLQGSAKTERPFRLLDIGTGTGCIPLALAYSLRHSARRVLAVGVDQSPDAVSLAQENIERCGGQVKRRVHVVRGDLFADDFGRAMKDAAGLLAPGCAAGAFDLVVSNPPYIPRRDYADLARSVREWEDRRALVGEMDSPDQASSVSEQNEDGLIFYRRIVSLLPSLLAPSVDSPPTKPPQGTKAPVVAFEVGAGQARDVQALLQVKGWRGEVVQDQWGIERLVLGYRT